MMTQQLDFSLLTAPLAATDRRALSQAWYSALHVASDRHATPARDSSSAAPLLRTPQHAPPREQSSGNVARPASHFRAVQHEARKPVRDVAVERRAARSPLARKIERSFLDPRHRIARATFTIDGTDARVHIALQSRGSKVRLIAICSPAVRATVARALEEARYALAERGITLCLQDGAIC